MLLVANLDNAFITLLSSDVLLRGLMIAVKPSQASSCMRNKLEDWLDSPLIVSVKPSL